jgi:methionyl-tRNA synthetase
MARILITSAIPYINGIKHLGNLVGSQLPADLYARYMRARGHEVLFLCATDEHGTPAELGRRQGGQARGGVLRRDVGGAGSSAGASA